MRSGEGDVPFEVAFGFTRKTLSALNLPRAYLTQFGIARAVQYIGLGIVLAAVIGEGI